MVDKLYILEVMHAFAEKTVEGKRFDYMDPNKITIEFDPSIPLTRFVTYVETANGEKQMFRTRHYDLSAALDERKHLLEGRRQFAEEMLAIKINAHFGGEKVEVNIL